MGGSGALAACGVVFAALGGGCLGAGLLRSGRSRVRGIRRLGLKRHLAVMACACTIARPFSPLARLMLKNKAVRRDAEQTRMLFDGAGSEALRPSEETVVGLVLAAAGAVMGLALLLSRSAMFALALGCLSVIACWGAIRRKSESVDNAMREEVPDALRLLADSFRSGHSLQQTMEQASADLNGRLGLLFGDVAKQMRMGVGTTEALAVFNNVPGVPELAFVAIALDIQHQSGGSVASVLESARDSVKDEMELARSLRVQTAQAKLSASIVTVMPFILVALFSLVSPGFLAPFFESLLGMVLLGCALVMQLAGILAVRRICRADQ